MVYEISVDVCDFTIEGNRQVSEGMVIGATDDDRYSVSNSC
jgi:hypothetical protein